MISVQQLKELLNPNDNLFLTLLYAFIVLLIFIIIARLFQRFISKLIIKKSGDVITGDFVGRIFWLIFMAIGILIFLDRLGLQSISNKLLAGAGLTTFIIGFALKDIGENFLSGIVLALNKPFNVGDIIQVDSITGEVKEMTLRETTIKTSDGKDVFIPNTKLITSPLVNYTLDGFQRFDLSIEIENNGVAIQELLHKLRIEVQESEHIIKRPQKEVNVYITNYNDHSIIILIHYWIEDINFKLIDRKIKTKLILSVQQLLKDEQIKIINLK